MCYEIVDSYQDALQLSSSSGSIESNIPRCEYWNYVDRIFVDDGQLYAVDFVVRSTQGSYFFEYIAINDKGEAVEGAEEQHSTCSEMVGNGSWAEWKGYKKRFVY
jgi:hypothetical protein